MTKRMLSVLAIGLLCGSAFAAPVALSNAQLDSVSAGQGVFDYVFGDAGGVNQASDNGSTLAADAAIAAADNGSNAVSGTDNTLTTALAAEGSIANNGNGNSYNDAEAATGANAIAGNDNTGVAVNLVGNTLDLDLSDKEADDESALATDNGVVFQNQADDGSAVATDTAVAESKDYTAVGNDFSNVIVGEGNTQTVDETFIEGDIEEGGMGQVAKYADACNSFNVEEVEIDVEVDIDDSFNTTTNTLEICGQDTLTAIVNAAALDDQNIGVNLNITSATSTTPANGEAGVGAVSSIDGNALAVSVLGQAALNNVVILNTPGVLVPGI